MVSSGLPPMCVAQAPLSLAVQGGFCPGDSPPVGVGCPVLCWCSWHFPNSSNPCLSSSRFILMEIQASQPTPSLKLAQIPGDLDGRWRHFSRSTFPAPRHWSPGIALAGLGLALDPRPLQAGDSMATLSHFQTFCSVVPTGQGLTSSQSHPLASELP